MADQEPPNQPPASEAPPNQPPPNEPPPNEPPPNEPPSNEPPRRSGLLAEPAPIFIAAATLFAIFINSANVGVILMLGVVALLLETRLRPKA